jgi:hypothetical protein
MGSRSLFDREYRIRDCLQVVCLVLLFDKWVRAGFPGEWKWLKLGNWRDVVGGPKKLSKKLMKGMSQQFWPETGHQIFGQSWWREL